MTDTITIPRALLEQAHHALRGLHSHAPTPHAYELGQIAMDAMRSALEQPQQEGANASKP